MRILILTAMTMLGLGMAQATEPRTAVLDVANITCPACNITIKSALRRDAGVLATQVDAKAGTVSVRFDPDKTTPTRLAKAITDAGFPARTRVHGH